MTSVLWHYDALDVDGESVAGELRADSEDSAVARVRDERRDACRRIRC